MGIADLVREIRKDRESSTGQRLFSYLKSRHPRVIKPMKAGDYFRISSLYKLCPREEVIASREDISRIESITPSLQITFDIGDHFHSLYRNEYWGPMGEWLGAWKCNRCGWDTDIAGLSSPPIKGKQRAKLTTMPEKCPKCGAVRYEPCSNCGNMCLLVCPSCHTPRSGVDPDTVDMSEDSMIVFKEWTVSAPDICLSGHPDGWRRPVGGRAIISDLKSHGSNGFIRRSSIREGHDVQVWGYQYCADETKEEDIGEVCYMNKSPWGDHSSFIRTIQVPFDKTSFEIRVKKPLMELQEGLSGGVLPSKICVSKDCPRAKNCQMASICWQ